MDLIYWLVSLYSMRVGGEVKGGLFILASCNFHFIRVHDFLVRDPSNNKSIVASLSNTTRNKYVIIWDVQSFSYITSAFCFTFAKMDIYLDLSSDFYVIK